MMNQKTLLSIIELGGYPDFSAIYQAAGYAVLTEYSLRKAIKTIKASKPDVIVAEFNFQSDFRDRSSNLESILAAAESKGGSRIIVFYELEHETAFQRFASQHTLAATLHFPIDTEHLANVINALE